MVITMGDLYKQLPKEVRENKVLAAMKVLDKKYKVYFHFSLKGTDYFFAEAKKEK